MGYHIVQAFLQDSTWSSVHVMSRNPSRNQVEGAHYHNGDLTSFEQLRSLLTNIGPSLIIYTASPNSINDFSGERTFEKINVQGTRNLLKAVITNDHIRYIIYTSSAQVMKGSSHNFITEDASMFTIASRAEYYAKNKAIADQVVLDANDVKGLRTLCLRLAIVYGERDSQCILGNLHAL